MNHPMKRHLPSALLAFAFLASGEIALSAPAKAARAATPPAALAAALSAVSPDALGGQLGLSLASRSVKPATTAASASSAQSASPLRSTANTVTQNNPKS